MLRDSGCTRLRTGSRPQEQPLGRSSLAGRVRGMGNQPQTDGLPRKSTRRKGSSGEHISTRESHHGLFYTLSCPPLPPALIGVPFIDRPGSFSLNSLQQHGARLVRRNFGNRIYETKRSWKLAQKRRKEGSRPRVYSTPYITVASHNRASAKKAGCVACIYLYARCW